MATRTIEFDFCAAGAHRKLACAIASLITSDMTKLDAEVNGTSKAITGFPKPLKAHYAIDMVRRADDAERISALVIAAQKYTQRAQAYIREKEGTRGHPFTIYKDVSTSTNPTEGETMNVSSGSVQSIVDTIDDNIPIPTNEKPTATDYGNVDNIPQLDSTQANAVRKLLEILNPNPAQIDPDMIRKLVADECRKYNSPKPTVVHVNNKNNSEPPQDMGIQHKLFPTLLKLVEVGYPIMLPGPAGSGKTTAVHNAAKAIGAELFMPPEGPVEDKYGMIGYMHNGFVETSLYHAAKRAAENPDQRVIYFVDEVDAGYPNALLVLNAIMENGYCTFANGERVEYGRNLQFIAGANTWGEGATHEYVGRNKLDAATLDRFVTLAWGYDEAMERAIAGDTEWTAYVQKVRHNIARAQGVQHIVSPRASLRGNALLKAGVKWNDCIEMVLRKGMKDDVWNRVKG